MPLSNRVEIASKLHQGVSMERILDDIKDSIYGKIEQKHMIKKQDVYNIKRQYNIAGIIRHNNDLLSVRAWVEEMKENTYNPILLFKEQGVEQDNTLDNFSKNDFILCFQTEFQKDMLEAFGKDTICIDSTHGTNQYDFHLITILVIDEYGEGIPISWMLSNREDAMALIPFFKAIKNKCKVTTPKWFMSDDADNFFNAWKGVFGLGNSKKILCTWHVDRSWRKAIYQHIKEKESQSEVYQMLQILAHEQNISIFM
jgi:hypothetical protein